MIAAVRVTVNPTQGLWFARELDSNFEFGTVDASSLRRIIQ